jgi:hypothetical protein
VARTLQTANFLRLEKFDLDEMAEAKKARQDCEDSAALQKVCERLGPGAVKNFFWRWLHRLPSPFSAADKAGYLYELAFR